MSSRTRSIPIDKIVIPDIRVSAKFTPEQEAFFKASVEKLGVIQDPVVRPLSDGRYEVIAGAHRIKELESQGAKEVVCKVIDADDKIAVEMNIVENLARGSYDPMEVCKQLNNYLEKGGIDGLLKFSRIMSIIGSQNSKNMSVYELKVWLLLSLLSRVQS